MVRIFQLKTRTVISQAALDLLAQHGCTVKERNEPEKVSEGKKTYACRFLDFTFENDLPTDLRYDWDELDEDFSLGQIPAKYWAKKSERISSFCGSHSIRGEKE